MHCKVWLGGWISSTSTSMARTATCQGPCSCWCSAYSFVGIGALCRGKGVSWWWPWRKNRKCYCGIFEQEDVERASCIGQHCFCLHSRSRYEYWMIHHTQCSQSCSQWIHNKRRGYFVQDNCPSSIVLVSKMPFLICFDSRITLFLSVKCPFDLFWL